jgi:hypothetical protein
MLKKPTIVSHILFPTLLGIVLLYVYQNRIRKASEIGLGEGTSIHLASNDYGPPHIMHLKDFPDLVKGWTERGKKETFLWLGNSQLHGINQFKEGNLNSIEYLNSLVKSDKKEVLAMSYPNANLQELLVSTLYASTALPLKGIILPVFYDDMREDGIRSEIQRTEVITNIQSKHNYFKEIPAIKSLRLPDSATGKINSDFDGIKETAQEVSEKYLNEKLEDIWAVWKQRGDIRGNVFNDLYRFRNASFGISASTVRKMIPVRYKTNYEAFLNILTYCKDNSIPLFVYIPPIRNDVPPPYELDHYKEFILQVENDCKRLKAHFANLEKIIPVQYWGVKQSTSFSGGDEIDFMHFQDKGHQLIAEKIYANLQNQNLLK